MEEKFHVPFIDYIDRKFVVLKKECDKCGSIHRFEWMYHYEDIIDDDLFDDEVFGSGLVDFYGCDKCFKNKREFFEFIQRTYHLPLLKR